MRAENENSDVSMPSSSSSNTNAIETNSKGTMPKHIPFPEFPGSSELLNELIMFLFMTCAAVMQFINIYRTVWWLPAMSTNHAVNFYLIDRYLIALIVLITARRLVYGLLLRVVEFVRSKNQQLLCRKILKYSFGSLLLTLLGVCVAKIYATHTYLSLFLLIYPIIVYLLIFGFQIEPFLRSSCEIEGGYFNGMPMHCCSSSPVTIRDEIEVLRNDFNNRFKQIIFTSMVNAYYAGFVPCFFAVAINYNVLWSTQHIIFIWLSGFTMCASFSYPSKYSDILHRASLHLGHWTRLELRTGASAGLVGLNAAVWSKASVWPNGSVVKLAGDLYRCHGPATVALPGNSSHSRFYKLFHNPANIYMILTTVQASIVLSEIILLYFTMEWHFVLSISFITLTNQFTFFKIMRDYLITKRLYTAETSISDKHLHAVH